MACIYPENLLKISVQGVHIDYILHIYNIHMLTVVVYRVHNLMTPVNTCIVAVAVIVCCCT